MILYVMCEPGILEDFDIILPVNQNGMVLYTDYYLYSVGVLI